MSEHIIIWEYWADFVIFHFGLLKPTKLMIKLNLLHGSFWIFQAAIGKKRYFLSLGMGPYFVPKWSQKGTLYTKSHYATLCSVPREQNGMFHCRVVLFQLLFHSVFRSTSIPGFSNGSLYTRVASCGAYANVIHSNIILQAIPNCVNVGLYDETYQHHHKILYWDANFMSK